MPFGNSSGSATEEGGNILAEWDSNWDFGDAFNSMLGNYGEIMGLGIENMKAQQPRDAAAFELWKRGKESGLESDYLARDMAKKGYADDRSALFARKRAEREAAGKSQRYETPEGRMEQSRRYMESLTGGPWDFQFSRPSAARNLPAAGDLSGQPFTPNPWLGTYNIAANKNPGAAFQAMVGREDAGLWNPEIPGGGIPRGARG